MAWRFEGPYTLSRFMKRSDFPECLEMGILGRSLDKLPSRSTERRLVVIRELMRQVFECVYSLHCSGIIHRDIKPGISFLSFFFFIFPPSDKTEFSRHSCVQKRRLCFVDASSPSCFYCVCPDRFAQKISWSVTLTAASRSLTLGLQPIFAWESITFPTSTC